MSQFFTSTACGRGRREAPGEGGFTSHFKMVSCGCLPTPAPPRFAGWGKNP